MQQNDYFVWDADPVLVDLGTLNLPFPVAIWGIVTALVLFFWGMSKIQPEETSKKGQGEKPAPEGWKVFALLIGSLVIGQLLFLILPSPTIQEIGPIQPRWYGVLFASAFVVGYIIGRKLFLTAGRKEEELEMLLTYILIGTVVGARLGHVLFYDPSYYLRNPAEIIAIWKGGLASHGAAIGILLAMYLYVQKVRDMNFLWLADRIAIVVAIGGAFIRTGNFFNSEILGIETDLPWAVVFASIDMVPRHPSMLYEAVLCIGIFALLIWMYRRYEKQPPEGALFGIFFVTLFTGRFLIEFTKENQAAFESGWTINMGQWLSIPLIIAGIWLLKNKVRWNRSSKK